MDLDQTNLEKIEALESHSSTIQVLAFIWSLSLVLVVLLLLAALSGGIGMQEALLIMVILLPSGVIGTGLFSRAKWSRFCGMALCYFSLLAIPVGTMIGMLGLKAFKGSPQLFGDNPPKHSEIKERLTYLRNHSEQAVPPKSDRAGG